jgi:hypothetical protein
MKKPGLIAVLLVALLASVAVILITYDPNDGAALDPCPPPEACPPGTRVDPPGTTPDPEESKGPLTGQPDGG